MSEKKKKNKRGIVLMSMGLLLLIAAGLLVYFRNFEEEQAGIWSADMAVAVKSRIPGYDSTVNHGSVENLLYTFSLTGETAIEVDGVTFIGILDIPSLGLSLPVQADWSDAKLKQSPCRYAGSVASNNLIIAGHNFPEHLGYLYRLRSGDDVWFTDASGSTYMYKVYSTETLASTDVKEMAYGDWDLTLFTCTTGGAERVALRCRLN